MQFSAILPFIERCPIFQALPNMGSKQHIWPHITDLQTSRRGGRLKKRYTTVWLILLNVSMGTVTMETILRNVNGGGLGEVSWGKNAWTLCLGKSRNNQAKEKAILGRRNKPREMRNAWPCSWGWSVSPASWPGLYFSGWNWCSYILPPQFTRG